MANGFIVFKVVLEEFLTLKAWIRKEKKFCWDNIQKIRSMETQDNGFLLVIDGVRKEKERLTAANPLIWVSRMVRLAEMTSHDYKHKISLGKDENSAKRE